MKGLTWNKALAAGASAGVFSAFLPALLGLLHIIEPVAAGINPLLGVAVGVIAGLVTYFVPNAVSKSA